MPGLVPGIHVFPAAKQGVDGRDIGERKRRRPFGRLCPAMTRHGRKSITPRVPTSSAGLLQSSGRRRSAGIPAPWTAGPAGAGDRTGAPSPTPCRCRSWARGCTRCAIRRGRLPWSPTVSCPPSDRRWSPGACSAPWRRSAFNPWGRTLPSRASRRPHSRGGVIAEPQPAPEDRLRRAAGCHTPPAPSRQTPHLANGGDYAGLAGPQTRWHRGHAERAGDALNRSVRPSRG